MADRTMKPISEALQELRDERGMTDTEIWAAAGVSSATMSRYIAGSRGSTAIDWRGAETIEKLARVFGLDPSYFIEYRMWQVRQAAKLHPHLTNEVYDLLMTYVAREPGGLSSLRSRGK